MLASNYWGAEICNREFSRKKLVFLFYSFTGSAGQNSLYLYSKFSCISPLLGSYRYYIKISRNAKSNASQPAAGDASHEMVSNSPPSRPSARVGCAGRGEYRPEAARGKPLNQKDRRPFGGRGLRARGLRAAAQGVLAHFRRAAQTSFARQ